MAANLEILFRSSEILDEDLKTLAKSQFFSLDGKPFAASPQAHQPQSPAFGHKAGEIIDQKYKIIGLLGEGGMGAVYQAHHLSLNKDVALKTFRTPNLTEDSWKRFQREAQAIARLDHPNIVKVFDFGVDTNNVPYYTMECLTGESLADRLEQGPLELDDAISIFLQVCHGLSAAHAKGIIHRDLKPANIFLARESGATRGSETVKLVDFGIAGLAREAIDGQKLTSTGAIFGSPLYMSPEQCLGKEVGAASDIYSYGCTLFETLSGSPPFKGENAFATMMMHQQSEAPRLRSPEGQNPPQRLQALLNRLMAKAPQDRYQSLGEVAKELEAIAATAKFKPAEYKRNSPQEFENFPRRQSRQSQTISKKLLLILLGTSALALALPTVIYKLRIEPKPIERKDDDVHTQLAIGGLPDGALENITIDPTKQLVVHPYRLNSTGKAQGKRLFKFPTDRSLGKLECYLNEQPMQFNAQGLVTIPERAWVRLFCDTELCKHPELFDGFKPDDLGEVILNHGSCDWSLEHIKHVCRLTHLKSLVLDDLTELDDRCIDELNRLTELKGLHIKLTNISSGGLSRLKRLTSLESLSVNGMRDISIFLEKMRAEKAIHNLELSNCGLGEDEIKIITTLTELGRLELSDNSKLNDKALEKICHLQKLIYLDIRRTGITPNCIDSLKNLPDLKNLSLDHEQWSQYENLRLSKTLKGCTIHTKNPLPLL